MAGMHAQTESAKQVGHSTIPSVGNKLLQGSSLCDRAGMAMNWRVCEVEDVRGSGTGATHMQHLDISKHHDPPFSARVGTSKL
jgi:hypothetical protein